jgi:hypothetical protein
VTRQTTKASRSAMATGQPQVPSPTHPTNGSGTRSWGFGDGPGSGCDARPRSDWGRRVGEGGGVWGTTDWTCSGASRAGPDGGGEEDEEEMLGLLVAWVESLSLRPSSSDHPHTPPHHAHTHTQQTDTDTRTQPVAGPVAPLPPIRTSGCSLPQSQHSTHGMMAAVMATGQGQMDMG